MVRRKGVIVVLMVVSMLALPTKLYPEVKTIIMHFNVLFRPNEKKIEQHVRKSISLWRGIKLLFSGIPTKKEIRRHLFSILQQVPLIPTSVDPKSWESSYIPWNEEFPSPPALCQLLTLSCDEEEQQLHNQVIKYIDSQSHINPTHKIIIRAVADVIFQNKVMNQVLEVIPDAVSLLKLLKQQNYTLILAAGSPGAAWDAFVHSYPQGQIIASLFSCDNIHVSGKEHLLPTSPEFFSKIMHYHDLEPQECLLISTDWQDNVYPQSIGMKTIIYDAEKQSFKNFYDELMALLART